jgi:hypothetical protein
MHETDSSTAASGSSTTEIVWEQLENPQAVEDWLDTRNRELQQLVGRRMAAGQGICFTFAFGGECYMHTNSDGDILLDLTADAAWVSPVIAAATQTTPPKGSVWLLPNQVLAQLVLGLNSLIASSRLVLTHTYRSR